MVKNPSSTVSSKGQITIPIEVRDRLGLHKGDRVEFVVENELTVMRPARLFANPFEKYAGALPAFKNKQQINKWIASLREDE